MIIPMLLFLLICPYYFLHVWIRQCSVSDFETTPDLFKLNFDYQPLLQNINPLDVLATKQRYLDATNIHRRGVSMLNSSSSAPIAFHRLGYGYFLAKSFVCDRPLEYSFD